jgi:Rne/Rng family ribonuclease
MKKEMLINVLQPEECRIAIVEDGVLEELYVERTSHECYVGNIYKGRIVNIEPSIQAAFVDFGVGRNGFLHVSDVEPTYYRHLEPRRSENGGSRGRSPRDRHRGPRRPRDDDFEPGRRTFFDEDEGVPADPESGADAIAAPGAPFVEEQPPRDAPEDAAPPQVSDHASEASADPEPPPGPPRSQFMDSAERRTEEDGPAAEPVEHTPPLSDSDLFFPPEAEAAPEAGSPSAEEAPAGDGSSPGADEFDEFEPAAEPFTEGRRPPFDGDESESRPRRRRSRDDRGGHRRRGPSRPGMGRPKPLIQDIFRRGQEVLVQVIKEGIGTKGPTLSTYISIAGRYLVLMPGLNRIGVSRKIADDEQRRRLREILSELQPPRGLGFIIRTAGLDKNKKELQRDLAYLSRLWQVVVRRIRKLKAPAEIYQESDMITRTIRDTFTSEIDTIWVDEPTAFEHAQEFLQIVMPRYASRIKLYGDAEPMFHKYGIEDEIARIQRRHVPLPNGGSIVIEQTEALVAIDVNSGNFRADNNAEETAYQMNLLAAKEIARQLRLRDLGGVIVNDFIDMREDKHRRGVERAMREAVKRDRARTKILKISAFGLIEMTRQRIRPSLKRSVYQDCPHCLGTGQVKTCESMSIDVMRMLQLAAHRNHVHRIQVTVAEEVAHYLLNKKRKEITRLEEAGDIQVNVTGAAGVAPEKLDFTCYDNNNNEVKFMPQEESRSRRR